MKKLRILIIFLLAYIGGFSQNVDSLVLLGDISEAQRLTDSTFSIKVRFQPNQFNSPYLPKDILADYDLIDGKGQWYRIVSKSNVFASVADFVVKDHPNFPNNSIPNARTQISGPLPSSLLPVSPVNIDGLSPSAAWRIASYNFAQVKDFDVQDIEPGFGLTFYDGELSVDSSIIGTKYYIDTEINDIVPVYEAVKDSGLIKITNNRNGQIILNLASNITTGRLDGEFLELQVDNDSTVRINLTPLLTQLDSLVAGDTTTILAPILRQSTDPGNFSYFFKDIDSAADSARVQAPYISEFEPIAYLFDIERLDDSIAAHLVLITNNGDSIAAIQDTLFNIRSDLDDLDSTTLALADSITALRNTINSLSHINSVVDFSLYQDTLLRLETLDSTFLVDLPEYDDTELRDSLTNHRTDINTNTTNISALGDSITQHRLEINYISDSILVHRNDLDSLFYLNDSLSTALSAIEPDSVNNTNTLQDSIWVVYRSNGDVFVDTIRFSKYDNILEDSIDALRARMVIAESNISDLTDSITQHRTELDLHSDTLIAHNNRINENVDSIAAHRIDINLLVDSVYSYAVEISNLHDSITQHRIDIGKNVDSLLQHRIDINKNVDSLVALRIDINKNIDSLTVHRTEINTIYDSLVAHRTDININIDSLVALRIDINKNIDSLVQHRIELNALSDSIGQHRVEIDSLFSLLGEVGFPVGDSVTNFITVTDSILRITTYDGNTYETTVNFTQYINQLIDSLSIHWIAISGNLDSINQHRTEINSLTSDVLSLQSNELLDVYDEIEFHNIETQDSTYKISRYAVLDTIISASWTITSDVFDKYDKIRLFAYTNGDQINITLPLAASIDDVDFQITAFPEDGTSDVIKLNVTGNMLTNYNVSNYSIDPGQPIDNDRTRDSVFLVPDMDLDPFVVYDLRRLKHSTGSVYWYAIHTGKQDAYNVGYRGHGFEDMKNAADSLFNRNYIVDARLGISRDTAYFESRDSTWQFPVGYLVLDTAIQRQSSGEIIVDLTEEFGRYDHINLNISNVGYGTGDTMFIQIPTPTDSTLATSFFVYERSDDFFSEPAAKTVIQVLPTATLNKDLVRTYVPLREYVNHPDASENGVYSDSITFFTYRDFYLNPFVTYKFYKSYDASGYNVKVWELELPSVITTNIKTTDSSYPTLDSLLGSISQQSGVDSVYRLADSVYIKTSDTTWVFYDSTLLYSANGVGSGPEAWDSLFNRDYELSLLAEANTIINSRQDDSLAAHRTDINYAINNLGLAVLDTFITKLNGTIDLTNLCDQYDKIIISHRMLTVSVDSQITYILPSPATEFRCKEIIFNGRRYNGENNAFVFDITGSVNFWSFGDFTGRTTVLMGSGDAPTTAYGLYQGPTYSPQSYWLPIIFRPIRSSQNTSTYYWWIDDGRKDAEFIEYLNVPNGITNIRQGFDSLFSKPPIDIKILSEDVLVASPDTSKDFKVIAEQTSLVSKLSTIVSSTEGDVIFSATGEGEGVQVISNNVRFPILNTMQEDDSLYYLAGFVNGDSLMKVDPSSFTQYIIDSTSLGAKISQHGIAGTNPSPALLGDSTLHWIYNINLSSASNAFNLPIENPQIGTMYTLLFDGTGLAPGGEPYAVYFPHTQYGYSEEDTLRLYSNAYQFVYGLDWTQTDTMFYLVNQLQDTSAIKLLIENVNIVDAYNVDYMTGTVGEFLDGLDVEGSRRLDTTLYQGQSWSPSLADLAPYSDVYIVLKGTSLVSTDSAYVILPEADTSLRKTTIHISSKSVSLFSQSAVYFNDSDALYFFNIEDDIAIVPNDGIDNIVENNFGSYIENGTGVTPSNERFYPRAENNYRIVFRDRLVSPLPNTKGYNIYKEGAGPAGYNSYINTSEPTVRNVGVALDTLFERVGTQVDSYNSLDTVITFADWTPTEEVFKTYDYLNVTGYLDSGAGSDAQITLPAPDSSYKTQMYLQVWDEAAGGDVRLITGTNIILYSGTTTNNLVLSDTVLYRVAPVRSRGGTGEQYYWRVDVLTSDHGSGGGGSQTAATLPGFTDSLQILRDSIQTLENRRKPAKDTVASAASTTLTITAEKQTFVITGSTDITTLTLSSPVDGGTVIIFTQNDIDITFPSSVIDLSAGDGTTGIGTVTTGGFELITLFYHDEKYYVR